jgi:hypothetical protein
MIQFDGETTHDAAFLNQKVTEHLGTQTFTPEQEAAIIQVIRAIASGYRHTISRMEWGPGWD